MVASAMAVAAKSHATELTPSDYCVALSRVRAAVDRDISDGTRSAPAALNCVLRCTVRSTSGGSIVFVDNRSLMSSLEASESKTGTARSVALGAVEVQIRDILSGVADASPTRQRTLRGVKLARTLLSSNVYASEPIPADPWLQKIENRITSWWNALLRKFKRPEITTPSVGPWASRVLLFTIGTLALGVLIWFLFEPLRALVARIAQGRKAGRGAPTPALDLAMSAEEAALVAMRDFENLMELARRHAHNNDYRGAFRLAYVASLVALDSEGFVRLNRSQTNWEYVRELKARDLNRIYDILLPATRDFDRIWYGLQPAGQSDFDRIEQSYNAIRRGGEVAT